MQKSTSSKILKEPLIGSSKSTQVFFQVVISQSRSKTCPRNSLVWSGGFGPDLSPQPLILLDALWSCLVSLNMRTRSLLWISQFTESLNSLNQSETTAIALFRPGFVVFTGNPCFQNTTWMGTNLRDSNFFVEVPWQVFMGQSAFHQLRSSYSVSKKSLPSFSNCLAENGSDLIACGNLHSVNPDHIVLKKIVLSGIPVRVHKGLRKDLASDWSW